MDGRNNSSGMRRSPSPLRAQQQERTSPMSPTSILQSGTAADKSMLPGHSQASLSAKLEATRAAFRAAQGPSRPLSCGGAGGSGASSGPASPTVRRGDGERPRAFTCYLCGQQYGRTSLLIHIPQCQKKWVAVEAAKLPRERRPLPPPPACLEGLTELPTAGSAIDEFNSQMAAYWDQVSLMACRICGRTFRPEAFEKHAKVCTPDNPGGPLGMPKSGAAAARVQQAHGAAGAASPSKTGASGGGGGAAGGYNPASRPRAYMCYLCGQQFGSASLLIHIPACYKKWLAVEAGKDPKERREPPPPPPELDQPLPMAPDDVDAFNQRMSDLFNGRSLARCGHCGRTMRPDALVRHQKACTAEHPMKAAGAAGGGGAGGGAPPGGRGGGSHPQEYPPEVDEEPAEMEECKHCGRRMRPEALAKHNRVCTADKPMKGVTRRAAPAAGPPPAAPAATEHPTVLRPTPHDGVLSGPPSPVKLQRQQGQQAPPPRAAAPPATPPRAPYAGADDDGGMEDSRIECPTCGRRFLEEALEKHSRVCAKVFASKRKPFDAAKHRLQGTDAAGMARPPAPGQLSRKPAAAPPAAAAAPPGDGGGGGGGVPKWKAQSEALRGAMAAMRQVTAALARGEDIRNIPVVPSAPDPSLVLCPHCGRRFNANAADRHIPACANTVNKPKFLKRGTGGSGQGAPQSKPLPRY